jgi:uncharacterized protein YbjT (DUF2867 family)
MNITVIGAAGRLGRQVVEKTSRRGHRVTGLARRPERLAGPGCYPASPRATAGSAAPPPAR